MLFKPNKLMIGDLLYDNRLQCNARVAVLNTNGIPNIDAEPIEITTDFLEKNFERNSENAVENVFGIFDDFYDLFIFPLQDGMWALEYFSCEFDIPYERVLVSWVHELQHFLTHCGIDKELII